MEKLHKDNNESALVPKEGQQAESLCSNLDSSACCPFLDTNEYPKERATRTLAKILVKAFIEKKQYERKLQQE